ncbi:MAG: SHD1 domain-containing protein [Pirellulales bacterium]
MRRVFRPALAATALVLLGLYANSMLTAAPRQWTDSTGAFSIRAELVEVSKGNVVLKKEDGTTVTVPVDRLSAVDKNYLTLRAGQKSAEAGSKAPATDSTTPEKADDRKPSFLKLADPSVDDKVSRAEWTRLSQRFREFDADKDNAVSESELESTGAAKELLGLLDADGDDKIARTEWTQLTQRFGPADKNKDGSLDEAELTALAESKSSDTTTPSAANRLASAGPTTWRGRIENAPGGNGEIELVVTGNTIVGRNIRGGGPPGGGGGGGGGGGPGLGTGTFTMTGDGRSGNMDATYTDGPQSGQLCMGIYETDGNTLRWCVNNRGQRPFQFATNGGSWLMVLQKVPTP